MKYLLPNSQGVIEFDKYLNHLKSIQKAIPSSVFEYAAEENNYNLDSNTSLHDAWLEKIEIIEASQGERNEKRRVNINLCFLGPFHDLKIHLSYQNVIAYKITANGTKSGHGDLAIHEFDLSENKLPCHTLLFQNESKIFIEFKELTWRIEKNR